MNVFKMYFLNYEMYYKSSISKFSVLRKDKRDILLRNMRKKPNSILKGWFESFIFFPYTFSFKLSIDISDHFIVVDFTENLRKKLPRLVFL